MHTLWGIQTAPTSLQSVNAYCRIIGTLTLQTCGCYRYGQRTFFSLLIMRKKRFRCLVLGNWFFSVESHWEQWIWFSPELRSLQTSSLQCPATSTAHRSQRQMGNSSPAQRCRELLLDQPAAASEKKRLNVYLCVNRSFCETIGLLL